MSKKVSYIIISTQSYVAWLLRNLAWWIDDALWGYEGC